MIIFFLQLEDANPEMWGEILQVGFKKANTIEFNILDDNPGKELLSLLFTYKGKRLILNEGERNRFYSYGRRVSFPNTPLLERWMKSLSFGDYLGGVLEDPAFLIDDEEVIGTISHENSCRLSSGYFQDSNLFPPQ